MRSTTILWAVALAALMTGCAAPPLAQAPTEGGSVVAIQLSTAGAVAFISTETPEEVLFVKLTAQGLLGDDILRSNHASGGRYYLLNARPGSYAAIASTKWVPALFPGGSGGKRTVFFSRELAEKTRVDVGPGEIGFMGRFDVLASTAFSGGDEVQRHFRQIITPGATGEGFVKGVLQAMGGEYTAWGGLRSSVNDETTRAEFMRSASQDLAGRGWDAVLTQVLASPK